ncbi:hypothetical protein, variant [Saprolegnia diclina VS20]|uniref:FYVE-type domain-containing protein n=1 Tax=Saprolegnia diclina (strain VS20) TaxID=1156394 RepID=T0PZJ3_SAPDV|nr:hypothetical protein, variant [Saprolegnia diclina VS20]XP_008618877.1 hypothetical protein SDRG_14520 [Saprolegnia diclina VS20]EQC27681.1 hypothetical protein SDRG_14520 [Saprolegnia diclina VS20]EQC27682.1 hypothetical protein, variant [Saprolegnia diclina VS20]|eukprot:XP_008618876.1 hypothetical protein, variant [Saprolegnia diclina VS20]
MRFRPDFYPSVSPSQHEHLRLLAKKSVTDLLQVAAAYDGSGARTRFEMLPPLHGNPDVQSICGTVTLQASLEDIEAIMQCHVANTAESQAFAKTVETHVKASALLLQLSPSMTINWAMIESQSSVMRHRDFVYVQCREHKVIDGVDTWVSCTHSVKIDGCPPLDESLELVRGGLYASGYVFSAHPTEGIVRATYVLSVDFKGRTPHAWTSTTLKNWCHALSRMQSFFDARHVGRLSSYVRSDMEVKSVKDVAYCHVCGGDFFAWTKKDNCRICGEVVCPSCTEKKDVALPSGVRKLAMCTVCLHSKFEPEKLSPRLRQSRSWPDEQYNARPPRPQRWSTARVSADALDIGDFTVPRSRSLVVHPPIEPEPVVVVATKERATSHRRSHQRSMDRASFEEMQRVCQPRLSFEADGDVDLFDKVF